jgi:hypothetical protein
VHVGGATATNIDFSHVLNSKLPVFIAVVVVLAFVLLMPGFNYGRGSSILRLSGTGPIDAWVPVLLFSGHRNPRRDPRRAPLAHHRSGRQRLLTRCQGRRAASNWRSQYH